MSARHLAAAAAALLLPLAGASSAGAATTIGPLDVATSPSSFGTSDGTFVNRVLPGGSIPSLGTDGNIVAWRFNAATSGAIRLIVVHPTGAPGEFTVTAADDQNAPLSGVHTFVPATPIPIAAGDTIGMVQSPCGALPRWRSDPGATFWVKDGSIAPAFPTVGQTFAAAASPPGAALFNADVEPIAAPPASLPAPVVGRVSVERGGTGGGEQLVVTGANFTADSRVLFGDVPAQTVIVDRFDRLTVVVPPHAPGTVDVQVVNGAGAGTVVGQYTYVGEPTTATPAPVAVAPAPTTPVAKPQRKPKKKGKGKGKAKKGHRAIVAC